MLKHLPLSIVIARLVRATHEHRRRREICGAAAA
jgi:hypothetical protein